MTYWSAGDILKQIAGELGIPVPVFGDPENDGAIQLIALLNSSGNELLNYYNWAQFLKQWTFSTVDGQDAYDLPADWAYFIDQTQWDRTNRWPLLGPKTSQEWAWLKGGLLAAAPRMRYRVMDDKFWIHPVPGSTSFNLAMEYVSGLWVKQADDTFTDMITVASDIPQYHPWLLVKFVKLKFYELKAFDTTGVSKDFMRIFNGLTGKDKGAPILSLSPRYPPLFIGPWSVPDGSWDVTP